MLKEKIELVERVAELEGELNAEKETKKCNDEMDHMAQEELEQLAVKYDEKDQEASQLLGQLKARY